MAGLSFHAVPLVERLELSEFPKGETTFVVVQMVGDGLGRPIVCPVIVIRGVRPGPTVGVTAAVHGDELNGIEVIHSLLPKLNPGAMSGAVIAVPVVNVPGYVRMQRYFNDHADLNRVMPGKANGTNSQVYAHRFMERIVSQFDYLLDLHTASVGRINSLYVRADLNHPQCGWLAACQNPEIILHNEGTDGTLRGAAMDRGITAITVEIGNPLLFQRSLVHHGVGGVCNVFAKLGVTEDEALPLEHEPIICGRSYWLYTKTGGILRVLPELRQELMRGQEVAIVTNIFGQVEDRYDAPEDGIVIGRATNPVNQTGSRILHIGIRADIDAFPYVSEIHSAKLPPAPRVPR